MSTSLYNGSIFIFWVNYSFKTQKWATAIHYRMCQTTINCRIILQLVNWFGNATESIFTFHLIICKNHSNI